jgi:hypothetical protein
MKTARLFIAILFLSAPLVVRATDDNAGTSAAQFLKIGAGARSTAIGSAFVGVADDINTVAYNPAGLATVSSPELTAMHTQYLLDLNYDFGAFALPMKTGTIALSASTLNVPDISKRGSDESDLGTFKEFDASYALSYGMNINRTLAWGVTGRYIKMSIDSFSANAWGGDLGVLKRFNQSPVRIGFAVRNFGQPISFTSDSDPQPLIVDLGVSTKFSRDRWMLAANVQKPRDNKVQFGGGTEWKQNLGRNFNYAVRGGYNSATTDAKDASGLSLGAGLGYKQFQFDFAWVPFGVLGNTFRYAATMRFE